MKVMQLTVHFSPNVGGVETHLTDLVNGLTDKNIDTVVLTYRPLTTETPWRIFETGMNLKIIRIPWLPGLFYLFVKNPFVEFLYLLPGLFIVTPFVIFLVNPEVIHAHGLVAGFIAVFWGNIFGKRVVISTHSLYQFPKKGLYRSFVTATFKRADEILTLSKQSKEEVVSLGIKSDKVEVFTYWIDLNKFKPIKDAKEKVGWIDKFVILFVGRLVKEKGIHELLEAANKWNKKISLAIAGSGPMEEEVNKQKAINNNVIFLGRVGQDELPKYYSAADLLIVPSTHEEGFGRVILESLACGTPVIGSNRGAIPEAMDDSVGSLIEVSPENIKSEVEYYFKKYINSEKITKDARKFALKRYGIENINSIIKTYNVKNV